MKRQEDDNTSTNKHTKAGKKENGWWRKLGSWIWRLETKEWMQCKVFIKIIIISIESFESNRKIQSTLTISSFPVVFCSTYYCYTLAILTTSCSSSSNDSAPVHSSIYLSIYLLPPTIQEWNNTKEKNNLAQGNYTLFCALQSAVGCFRFEIWVGTLSGEVLLLKLRMFMKTFFISLSDGFENTKKLGLQTEQGSCSRCWW